MPSSAYDGRDRAIEPQAGTPPSELSINSSLTPQFLKLMERVCDFLRIAASDETLGDTSCTRTTPQPCLDLPTRESAKQKALALLDAQNLKVIPKIAPPPLDHLENVCFELAVIVAEDGIRVDFDLRDQSGAGIKDLMSPSEFKVFCEGAIAASEQDSPVIKQIASIVRDASPERLVQVIRFG